MFRNLVAFLVLFIIIGAFIALSGCASTQDDEAFKFQAVGLNVNAKTGVSGGTVSATAVVAPKVSKDGKTLYTVTGPCGQTDSTDVASNLNSNANAQASGTGQTGAWASGDQFYAGHAARYIGLGGGQAPSAAAIAAAQNCASAVPAAPAGSIVPAAAAAAH